MFGWSSVRRCSNSRCRAATAATSCIRSSRRIFSATKQPRSRSCASQTSPLPPVPRRRTRTNLADSSCPLSSMMRCVVSKEAGGALPAAVRCGGRSRRSRCRRLRLDRQTGLVLVEFLQQSPPLVVLLFGCTLELQSAPFDLDDHRLDFGLEGFPELLQGFGVHLHFRALVEAALDCIRAAKNRAGGCR